MRRREEEREGEEQLQGGSMRSGVRSHLLEAIDVFSLLSPADKPQCSLH